VKAGLGSSAGGAQADKPSKALSGQHYGIDDPYEVMGLAGVAALSLVLGYLGVVFQGRLGGVMAFLGLLGGLIVGLVSAIFAFSLFWSSRSWKSSELERLGSSLPWGGDELVLDAGCGRGPFSVIVAKKLSAGRVVCLDVWRKRDVSGNDPRWVIANAQAAGVGDRVLLVRADPSHLPFPGGVFDAVVSGFAINHVRGSKAKESAVADAVRVLKGGGRLAFLVAGAAREAARVLEKESLRDTETSAFRLGLFPPAQSFVARKSFAKPA